MLKSSNNTALEKRKRPVSLIWVVPCLAVIITGLLLWTSFFNKGELITLESSNASGMEAGKTLVKYRSVTVGKVESVSLAKNRQTVEVKVRMDPNESGLLREDTKFYVIKPRVESSNITGLETLISGNYIQISLGKSDKFKNRFPLQDEVPSSEKEINSLVLSLISESGRRIRDGEPVLYRGFVVGEVINAELDPHSGKITYQVSIQSKYKSLVGSKTVFWVNSGLDFSFGMQGVSFRTENLQNLLSGGITFEDLGKHGTEIKSGHESILYDSYKSAMIGISETHAHYVLMVKPSLGVLKQGAIVRYKGMQIGHITDSPWYEDTSNILNDEDKIPVRIALSIQGVEDSLLIEKFDRLVNCGYLVASLTSSSLLSANDVIDLKVYKKKKCHNEMGLYRGIKILPLTGSSSFSSQINALLDNMNKIDYEGISKELKNDLAELNVLIKRLNHSINSIENAELVRKASVIMDGLQKTLDQMNGSKTQDFVSDLRSVVSDIDSILKSVKPAASMVGQQPNSLIFDNVGEDPTPGSDIK